MPAMRLVVSGVCSSLVALGFVTPSPAQSTSPSAEPIPASEVKYRHPILETSRFTAYLLEIPPHHATLMHRHDRDILSVFVSGAKTTSTSAVRSARACYRCHPERRISLSVNGIHACDSQRRQYRTPIRDSRVHTTARRASSSKR